MVSNEEMIVKDILNTNKLTRKSSKDNRNTVCTSAVANENHFNNFVHKMQSDGEISKN
jgi:hypothetical protein